MVEVDSQDLICLHLDAYQDDHAAGVAPRELTAIGIGDALELGETSAGRVRVLDDLEVLEAQNLVRSEERPTEGFDAPRTIYELTTTGQERTASLREDLQTKTVTITNGTAKEVQIAEIEQYLSDTAEPLVTALARISDDGNVSLDDPSTQGFVDRETALESVVESIESSFNRESRPLLVLGATGIGKTALVLEAVEGAQRTRSDLLTARGNCDPEPTTPYQPFLQAIEQLPNASELRARIQAAQSGVTPEDPEQLEAQRTALFNDIADGIREASTRQPIVFFLDDLHWAGEPTLDLLDHLSTAIDEIVYPVAFVTTARDQRGRLDTIEAAEEVTLDPLEPDDARALIAGIAGSQQVPDGFFEYVYRKTGGNPLYVRETVIHLKETGRIDPDAGRFVTEEDEIELPATVTDQIEERLSALDDVSRELLRIGAVIGERIPGEILATVVDLEPAERREYIDVLVASRLWEPVVDDYRFISSGVREAVADRLTEELERSLHDRVAEAYLDVFGTDLTDEAARVAHHFERAGTPDQAIEYYRRAGEHAMSTYANQDAIEHYRRAIHLDDGDVLEDLDQADIRSDLAAVFNTMGAFDRARDAIEKGLATVPSESRAACRLLGQQASTYVQQGAYDAALDAAERQRALADRLEAPELLMEAIRQQGNVAFGQGRYDDAMEYYEESLELARDLQAISTEAEALSNLGIVAFRRGRFADARERYRQSLERARELNDSKIEAKVLNSLGAVAFKQGEYETAKEHYEETLEIARSIGDRQTEGHSLNNLGLISQRRGNYTEARRFYNQSLELRRKIGNQPGEAINLDNLGLVAQRQGKHETAREYYQESLEISRDIGNRPAEARSLNNLAIVSIHTDRLDQAEDFLERSLEITDDIGSPEPAADARHYLGLLSIEQGDLDSARENVEAAIESFESIDDRFGVAEATFAAGQVAYEEGRQERAMDLAEQAQTTFQELGAIHWVARCQLLLGRALAEAGRENDAISQWRTAVETFRDIGADHDGLRTLRHLVAAQRESNPAEATEWCRMARAILVDTSEAIADEHRQWVEECESALLEG